MNLYRRHNVKEILGFISKLNAKPTIQQIKEKGNKKGKNFFMVNLFENFRGTKFFYGEFVATFFGPLWEIFFLWYYFRGKNIFR